MSRLRDAAGSCPVQTRRHAAAPGPERSHALIRQAAKEMKA
jgi:hypothetical protein